MKINYISLVLVIIIQLKTWGSEPIRVTANNDYGVGRENYVLFTNNQDMDKYISSIKSLSCNSTLDDVEKVLGEPSHKSDRVYSYTVGNLLSGNLNEAISEIKERGLGNSGSIKFERLRVMINGQENKKIGRIYIDGDNKVIFNKMFGIESEIQDLITTIKSLKIGEDTSDDFLKKLKIPYQIYKSPYGNSYGFGGKVDSNNIMFSVSFDNLGKLNSVRVNKDQDVIYEKTLPNNIVQPALSNASTMQVPKATNDPITTDAGQIYFNPADSHFYGYNGKEWLQLDNPKN
jgi:hypothetical protein